MGSNQETWWKDWDYLPWSWLVPWLLREAMRHEVQKSGVWGWFFFLNLLFCTGVEPIHYTEAEVEASVFWSPDTDSWPIGKVPDAGKDWGEKEKASEDEMVVQHHQCNGQELGQTSGDGKGQGGLLCRSQRGSKESGTTGWLNNNSNIAN